MHRFARAFELTVSYFGIAVLLVLIAATNSVPTSSADSSSTCVAPSFYSLTITPASLNTPWSLPLLSSIDGPYVPTVKATGLPPGIVLDDQKTTLQAGGGTLHNWVLDGAATSLGTYTINVTAQNSCGGSSTVVTLPINNVVTAQGSVQCPAGTTGLYPNCQQSSAATVSFDTGSLTATTPTPTITGTSNTQSVSLMVQNSVGATVYSSLSAPVVGGHWSIQLSSLSTGLYKLYLYSNGTLLIPGSLVVAIPSSPSTSVNPSSVPTAHVDVQNGVVIPNTTASNSSGSSCLYIGSALQYGSRGNDVYNLQLFLTSQGLLPQGSATGYFGTLTRAAVQQFQAAQGIVSSGNEVTTGFGLVGAHTRAVIQQVSCSSSVTQPVQHISCALPVIPPCPGGSPVSLGVDQNGCSRGYTCKQAVTNNCPSVGIPSCTHGTAISLGTDINGCSLGYQCQEVSCNYYVQPTCAPGQTLVSQNDQYGCPLQSYCSGTPTPNTFTASPSSGTPPLTVTFSGTANGSYSINYGDGSIGPYSVCDFSSCGSTSISQTHTYTAAGTYNATLTNNDTGQVTTATVTVTGAQANASLTASPASGTAPLSVTFTGSMPGTYYNLDFGDGSQPIGAATNIDCVISAPNCAAGYVSSVNQTHTYAAAGRYTATLTGNNGQITTATVVAQ